MPKGIAGHLTPKQERFCQAYAKGVSGGVAYAEAYGQTNSPAARSASAQALRRPSIAARVAELRQRIAETAGIDTAQVLREAARIAFSDPGQLYDSEGNFIPVHLLPPNVRAAISSVDVEEELDRKTGMVIGIKRKVRLWPKDKAVDMLMKHIGAYAMDNKQRIGLFDEWSPEQRKMGLAAVLRAIDEVRTVQTVPLVALQHTRVIEADITPRFVAPSPEVAVQHGAVEKDDAKDGSCLAEADPFHSAAPLCDSGV